MMVNTLGAGEEHLDRVAVAFTGLKPEEYSMAGLKRWEGKKYSKKAIEKEWL